MKNFKIRLKLSHSGNDLMPLGLALDWNQIQSEYK